MPSKFLIYFSLTIGSIIGGYIPMLFGASILSISSLLGSGIGSLLGIFVAFKIAKL